MRSSNSLRLRPRYSLSSSRSSTRWRGARKAGSWRSWAWQRRGTRRVRTNSSMRARESMGLSSRSRAACKGTYLAEELLGRDLAADGRRGGSEAHDRRIQARQEAGARGWVSAPCRARAGQLAQRPGEPGGRACGGRTWTAAGARFLTLGARSPWREAIVREREGKVERREGRGGQAEVAVGEGSAQGEINRPARRARKSVAFARRRGRRPRASLVPSVRCTPRARISQRDVDAASN